jgi:fumarylpyruvate hydrolase
MNYAFPPAPVITLDAMSSKPFPVRRIFCVGQNYPDHAREIGTDPGADEPFFFMKPAGAILQNHSVLPYPPGTEDLQPEVELVVALHRGGRNIPAERVDYDYVFGYAVGLDMTRRDLQRTARARGGPGTWPRHSTILPPAPRSRRSSTPAIFRAARSSSR